MTMPFFAFLPHGTDILWLAVLWIPVIWALIDCLKNEPPEGNSKLVWVVVILVLNLIGAVLYFIIRRPQRIAEAAEKRRRERGD